MVRSPPSEFSAGALRSYLPVMSSPRQFGG